MLKKQETLYVNEPEVYSGGSEKFMDIRFFNDLHIVSFL